MSDTTYEMYASPEETETDFTVPLPVQSSMSQIGVYTEISIGGQTTRVIDPTYVIRMESRMNAMAQQIQLLQNQLRSMQSMFNNQTVELRNMQRELASKVSYE